MEHKSAPSKSILELVHPNYKIQKETFLDGF